MWGNDNLFFGKRTIPTSFNTLLIAPDVWRSGYPMSAVSAGFKNTPGEYSDHIGRCVFKRHDDRNNIAFVDGHVERVYLPEMGLLRWHREWVRQESDVPWLGSFWCVFLGEGENNILSNTDSTDTSLITLFKAWPGFSWWSDPDMMEQTHEVIHSVPAP